MNSQSTEPLRIIIPFGRRWRPFPQFPSRTPRISSSALSPPPPLLPPSHCNPGSLALSTVSGVYCVLFAFLFFEAVLTFTGPGWALMTADGWRGSRRGKLLIEGCEERECFFVSAFGN